MKIIRHLPQVTFEILAALVLHVRENGGATFDLILGRHCEPSDGRYRYSSYKYAERSMPFSDFNVESLNNYIQEFQHHFLSYEIGIWHNQDDGLVYLDISEANDELETALDFARICDQLAIYDTVTGETIPVPDEEV